MSSRLSVAIIWVVGIVTATAAVYELWALTTGNITISLYVRELAEAYPLVYIIAGAILACLFLITIVGTHLPKLIRFIILVWIFVFGHIFWGF